MLLKPNNNLDILILTETFCFSKVPDSLYHAPGYQVHRKDRLGKTGGGVLAFVKDSIQVKRRTDLEVTELEALWLEVCPLLIAGVYRSPSYKVADDRKLGKNIANAYLLNREIIILVDFNIDFMNETKATKYPLVITFCYLNMSQLVHELKCDCNEKIFDPILNTTEQHFHTTLNGVFSFSISCFVLEIFRFFETCKLGVSDVIYSRITNYIYQMVNISVNSGQKFFKLCINTSHLHPNDLHGNSIV